MAEYNFSNVSHLPLRTFVFNRYMQNEKQRYMYLRNIFELLAPVSDAHTPTHTPESKQ